jgi:SOS-response transcriptional repressor LexA
VTPLTERQQEVLDAIRSLTVELGMSPSIRELGARIGHSSTCSTHRVLFALMAKGYVTHTPDAHRSLRLVGGPIPVSAVLPKEVADTVQWHALRLCGGNVGEMMSRIVGGWAQCNPIERER